MKNIKITGRDIIGFDGLDHTDAFKELGVELKPSDIEFDSELQGLTFNVDLDFVLRHGLLDRDIYDNHYAGTEEYLKYFNEGKECFERGGDESENQHNNFSIADKDFWTESIYHKRYPWYDGFRQTRDSFFKKKYNLDNFQEEIKSVIKKYGLTLEYTDEYHSPYATTPEGFVVQLA